MTTLRLESRSEDQTEALGRRLAASLPAVRLIYVRGPLGAGKTTFVRGLLRGLGYAGPVKSPTFTLVEPYEVGAVALHHFDLYRIVNPAELEFLALRDYVGSGDVCVVEWPEHARGALPTPDLDVMIEPRTNRERDVRVSAHSAPGEEALRTLQ
jgi:tRNA threonylcarbamoyladenosine biosynthesis protein TsaE